MYIVKNAVHNLWRNRGRNILMGIILYAILLAVAVSIIVAFATAQLIEHQKEQFGAPINLILDYRKIPPDLKYTHLPTAEELLDYTNSDFLMKSQITTSFPVTIKEFKKGGEVDDAAMVSLLSSFRRKEKDEFTSGMRTIIEGQRIQDRGQCVISKELAKRFHIKVGQTITLTANNTQIDIGHEDRTVPKHDLENAGLRVKVVGIYENHIQTNGIAEVNAEQVFLDFQTLISSNLYKASNALCEGSMILKKPEYRKAFEKELGKKGLPKYYNVHIDDTEYKKITVPLEGMKSITNTFTIVVTIFGIIVLLTLSILSIRERKYEVGVLRAMGLKKTRVAMGLVCETFFITMLCLFLSIATAMLISKPIGDWLLETQTAKQVQNTTENTNEQGDAIMPSNNGFADLTTTTSKPMEVKAELGNEAGLVILFIALVLALSASSAGILFVTRFEPRKILSERN